MKTIHEHLDLSKHKRNAELDYLLKIIILLSVLSITFILARGY